MRAVCGVIIEQGVALVAIDALESGLNGAAISPHAEAMGFLLCTEPDVCSFASQLCTSSSYKCKILAMAGRLNTAEEKIGWGLREVFGKSLSHRSPAAAML